MFAAAVRQGTRISVRDVVPGMEVITSWHDNGKVHRSIKIEKREPCSGGNGMHVHLNKSNCYDSRAFVWVK
jgi:hypothetical protein